MKVSQTLSGINLDYVPKISQMSISFNIIRITSNNIDFK